MISTPCQNICTMDSEKDQCFGCGRTRDEIAMWSSLSEEARLDIMNVLPERLKNLEDTLKAKIDQTPIRSTP